MTRPPHARQAILAAAEALVRDVGASHLTFDELVRRSGVTRGGITYHFPTKEALLEAIIHHDIEQWNTCVDEQRPRFTGKAAALQALIASSTEADESANRLCAGLLSVAAGSSPLTGPWKRYYADQHEQVIRPSADPVTAAMLALATEGLFWQETLGLSPLTPEEREQVVERLLSMAKNLGETPP